MSSRKAMSRREEWLEFWERRESSFLRLLPYVPLGLCVAFDVATRHGGGRGVQVDPALAAAATAVMAAMDRLDHRTTWTDPRTFVGPVLATVVFATLLGLSA